MRDQHGYEPPKGLVMRCPDCAILGIFSYMTPTTNGGSKSPWGPGLGWWCHPHSGTYERRCGLCMPRRARLRDLPGHWLRYAKWWVTYAPTHVKELREYRWKVAR